MALKKYFWIFAVLLLSIPTIFPFFHLGFFSVHDNTQVPRVFEMRQALNDGDFPVRIVKDLGYGYGYPIFNFYSPFPYYVGAAVSYLHVLFLDATKMMIVIPVFLAGLAMFLALRRFVGNLPSIASAVIYEYFPYHAVNTYIRGDIGELYFYMLLPLVFLGIYELFKQSNKMLPEKNIGWVLFSAVSIALVIVSHNLSAYMLFLMLIPGIIALFIFSNNKKKFLILFFSAGLLAFLLSAFYSLPALLEMKYTNIAGQIGGGADYHDHFVCLNQFWDSPWGFGGSAKGCTDGLSFRLGKVNIIFIILSIITSFVIWRKKKDKTWYLLVSSIFYFFFSMFLMIDLSGFLWKLIPAMSYLQYPWRFLNFAGFFMSLSVGFALFFLENKKKQLSLVIIAVVSIVLTIYQNGKLFNPKEYQNFPSQYYTNNQYIRWTVSKISDEYLPYGFQKPQKEGDLPQGKISILEGYAKAQITKDKTTYVEAHVIAVSDTLARLNIAYFPGWIVKVDNKQSDYAIKNNGIAILIRPGFHAVQAQYIETSIQKLGDNLSIFGIIVAVFGIMIWRNYRYEARKTS